MIHGLKHFYVDNSGLENLLYFRSAIKKNLKMNFCKPPLILNFESPYLSHQCTAILPRWAHLPNIVLYYSLR